MPKGKFQGRREQFRELARKLRAQWANRNLYRATGQLEPFVAVLQTQYGYTRAYAEEEFHRRKAQFEAAKPEHRQNAGEVSRH